MPELDLQVLSWLARDHGAPEDRAAHAELRIDAGGVCLTEVADRAASSVRPSVRVSAAALADWLLQNRWRILYEPDRQGASGVEWSMAHRLGAIGLGFAWPDLTLASDGERVTVRARRAGGPEDLVRYLNEASVHVSLGEVDGAVDRFVDAVVARLVARGLGDSPLVGLAAEVGRERADADATRLRIAEARLGLDPDEVDAEAVLALTGEVAWAGEAAAAEILSELTYAGAAETLPWIRERATRPDVEVDLSDLGQFAGEEGGGLPWERGVRLARSVRRGLGIGLEPVDLDGLLGADLRAPRVDGARPMGVAVGDQSLAKLTFRRVSSSGRRFEAARVIADWLTRPSGDIASPLTDRKTARQQLQRAFAAEFLCPAEGLAARVSLPRPSDDELEAAAAFYEVSEVAVRSVLVNHRLVGRGVLAAR